MKGVRTLLLVYENWIKKYHLFESLVGYNRLLENPTECRPTLELVNKITENNVQDQPREK